jgi:hypothetical protein
MGDEQSTTNEAIPMDYVEEEVDIVSLARDLGVIRRHRFIRCRISGPAIIYRVGGCVFANNVHFAPAEAVYWPIDDNRLGLAGVIPFENCVVAACELLYIGIAVPRGELRLFLEDAKNQDLSSLPTIGSAIEASDSGYHPLPCCGRQRWSGSSPNPLQLWHDTRRRPTVSNDLKAFLLSLGGLLAVAGSGLLVLWAVVS